MFFPLILSMFLFQDGNNELSVKERFRVEFVMLDVIAVDRKGRLVTDLKASDFVVTENKKKVDVSYFDILDYREGAKPNLEDVPEEFREQVSASSLQQIVLAVDLGGVEELDTKRIMDQLREFVRSLDPEVEQRINIYSMERGSISKGFLSSKEGALEALNDLEERHRRMLLRQRGGSPHETGTAFNWDGNRRSGRGGMGSGLGSSMLDEGFRLTDLEEAFSNCNTLFSGSRSQQRSCINETLSEFIGMMGARTDSIIGQLELLTYDFEDTGGLKMMLFVSPGFPLNAMSGAVELAKAYMGNSDTTFLGAGSSMLDIRGDFRRVVHACTRNRIVFHTFDIFHGSADFNRKLDVRFRSAPSGQVTRAYRAFSLDVSDGMRSLADESGGTFHQINRLKGGMKKVVDNNKFFYVLGYNSLPGKAGKFRKIKIKTNRKGVKLRHRKGYFAKSDDPLDR